MARPPRGALGNSPRDERDDFVGEPAEELKAGPPLRWPPKPKKITKDTFHAKVEGRTSQARADRKPHFRKGGWVGFAQGGEAKNLPGDSKNLPQPDSSKSTNLPQRKAGGSTGGKWMQGAVKHPGALHRSLGVPAGKKIPAAKIEKATHSSNPTLKKRAVLAETFAKHRPG